MVIFINTFRHYIGKTRPLWVRLNDYSFGVYIIHFIVMGVIAMGLLDFSMPSLAKYLLLTVTAYAASNVIVSLYRQIKRSILN
jgi:peptidoglycan/LPS O-acetylase OafA/YrhL